MTLKLINFSFWAPGLKTTRSTHHTTTNTVHPKKINNSLDNIDNGGCLPRKTADKTHQMFWVAHIDNLPLEASKTEVRDLFVKYGDVHSIILHSQKDAARQNRCGWIVMKQADKAVRALNGSSFAGHRLQIKLMGLLFPNMASLTQNQLRGSDL
jgi:hypothetical protein